MTDSELVRTLRERGGTPPEVLNEPDLLAHFLPVIRMDFRLINSYGHSPATTPLDVPMTVLGGTNDSRAKESDLMGWKGHTTNGATITMFDGEHFFITSAFKDVVTLIAQTIRETIGEAAVESSHRSYVNRSL